MSLNGRGGFSKSQSPPPELGCLLPEWMPLLSKGISISPQFLYFHGNNGYKNSWPLLTTPLRNFFFFTPSNLQWEGIITLLWKASLVNQKPFDKERQLHLDSTSLIYSELSTVSYVAFCTYPCQKLNFLWPE